MDCEEFRGEITFKTHSIVVNGVDDKLYCFKCNDKLCSLETFDDFDEMIEWVLQPFPTLIFGLVLE